MIEHIPNLTPKESYLITEEGSQPIAVTRDKSRIKQIVKEHWAEEHVSLSTIERPNRFSYTQAEYKIYNQEGEQMSKAVIKIYKIPFYE